MRLTCTSPTSPTSPASRPVDPSPSMPQRGACRATGRRGSRTWHAVRWVVAVAAVSTVCVGVLVAAATPVLAAGGQTQVVAVAASVGQVLTNLRNWLMGILAGLATVFLTVGGVRYLMAGGDPGEVEAAKRAFKSAGWGYVGAALAPLIVTILSGIVGA